MTNNIKIAVLFSLIAFSAGIGADNVKHFHHCAMVGGSGNSPHLFDVSEIYSCDEGSIEVAGQMREVIENGYVYRSELGRPTGRPYRVADRDYKSYKWCAALNGSQERCGDKPGVCWDGKQGTWDDKWQGYSCVTPDHDRINNK